MEFDIQCTTPNKMW